MEKINDVHQQFAEFFPQKELWPYYYILSQRLAEGSITVPIHEIELEELPEAYRRLLSEKDVIAHDKISDASAAHPIVFHKGNLYLQRYFKYETSILEHIKTKIEGEKNIKETMQALLSKREKITNIFPSPGEDKNNWQLAAALSAVLNDFTIITGGPGTGKTTTVAAALSIFKMLQPQGLRIALAAPTGKAAGRMAESLKKAGERFGTEMATFFAGLEPQTMHRLLGTQKGTHYFRHDAKRQLAYDIIIADESSMLDVALFAKFLDAVPQHCKVILLGDKNQLAAVEAGSLFGDLCQAQDCLNDFTSERDTFFNEFITGNTKPFAKNNTSKNKEHILFQHVIELQDSHRFSIEEGIGKLSEAVITNNVTVLQSFYQQKTKDITISEDANKKLFEAFAAGYASFIQEKDIGIALKKFNNLRILCAIRNGKDGVYTVNRNVELYLQKLGLVRASGQFYENKPVMITENNYELGLFNGDIGIVRADENNVMKVWFEKADGTLQGVLSAYLPTAETAFVMTIHKSQGSEFEEVFIILPELESNRLLSRELLYTGITRAKKRVTICCSEAILLQTAAAKFKRSSGLAERFINDQQ